MLKARRAVVILMARLLLVTALTYLNPYSSSWLNLVSNTCLAHLERGVISPYFNVDFIGVNMEGSKIAQFKTYLNICA
jgi:hypothetical protein